MSPNVVESLFLKFSVDKLGELMNRVDACLGKLTQEQIWARGAENENAVGNLVLHLTGNVRQWIVSTLGNNPAPRDRDGEFNARQGPGAAELSKGLRGVLEQAQTVISGLDADSLTRMYEVQSCRVSGVEAVYHVVEHFAEHTGQIIFITKMLTGSDLEFYGHLRQPRETSPR